MTRQEYEYLQERFSKLLAKKPYGRANEKEAYRSGVLAAKSVLKDDLEGRFRDFAKRFRRKSNIAMVYVLTNFNSTMDENLHRIYTLRDMGYDPYVMIYNKPNAPHEIMELQRWCNNKIVFGSCKKFEDYSRRIG